MSTQKVKNKEQDVAIAFLGSTLDYFTPLLNDAWNKWGQDLQIDMLIEEMAELTVKLNHFKRKRIRKITLCEEIADVLICLSQVIKALDLRSDIDEKIYAKMRRLKERLKIENGG